MVAGLSISHLINLTATEAMPVLSLYHSPGLSRRLAEDSHSAGPLSSSHSLLSRQSDGGDSGSNNGTCLGGGEIAGIVIGTIFGTLLVLWLIQSCTGGLARPTIAATPYQEEIEPKRHHKHHSRSRHSRRRSSGLSEPPPVILADRSRSRHRQPTYVYTDDLGRGRR